MNAFLQTWAGFFAAELGAAATLGGLVFVGLSLNLTKILAAPNLVARALLALVLLVVILIVSSMMLMPNMPVNVVGAITLLLGVTICIAGTLIQLRTHWASVKGGVNLVINLALFECSAVPYAVAGWLLLTGDTAVFAYWLAAGIIISFVKAMLDSWVLLVEINR